MEYKYLSSIPKPLLNDFLSNKVIPFIGAGFSKNADIADGLSMPDWNELGKIAADEIPTTSTIIMQWIRFHITKIYTLDQN